MTRRVFSVVGLFILCGLLQASSAHAMRWFSRERPGWVAEDLISFVSVNDCKCISVPLGQGRANVSRCSLGFKYRRTFERNTHSLLNRVEAEFEISQTVKFKDEGAAGQYTAQKSCQDASALLRKYIGTVEIVQAPIDLVDHLAHTEWDTPYFLDYFEGDWDFNKRNSSFKGFFVGKPTVVRQIEPRGADPRTVRTLGPGYENGGDFPPPAVGGPAPAVDGPAPAVGAAP